MNAQQGVPETWLVNSIDQTIEVYTRHEQSYLVAGVYLPGESIAAGQFAGAKILVDAVFQE